MLQKLPGSKLSSESCTANEKFTTTISVPKNNYNIEVCSPEDKHNRGKIVINWYVEFREVSGRNGFLLSACFNDDTFFFFIPT